MGNYSREKIVLQDISKTGKVRPWNERKRDSIKVASSYFRLGYDRRAEKIRSCGNYLEFKRYSDNTLKLWHASFCKSRLCPMCAWRKSLVIYHQVRECMEYLKEDYEYIFLTLTVKNCNFDELDTTLDNMKDGLNKLFRVKRIKNITRGLFYGFEITVNQESLTFHPHIHICVAVNKNYFKKGYISQSEWTLTWRNSCRLEYNPIVHIEKFKGKIEKAVAEAAKYTVKSADLIYDDEFLQDVIIQNLDDGLYQKRLIGYRGVFAEARKALKQEDVENMDLIDVGDSENSVLEYQVEKYFFQTGINLGFYERV